MISDQREIQRKLRVLKHADRIGAFSKTCRYFGVGRASFTRWRHAYEEREARPVPRAPVKKEGANAWQSPPFRLNSRFCLEDVSNPLGGSDIDEELVDGLP